MPTITHHLPKGDTRQYRGMLFSITPRRAGAARSKKSPSTVIAPFKLRARAALAKPASNARVAREQRTASWVGWTVADAAVVSFPTQWRAR
jgi:hypothetical protein